MLRSELIVGQPYYYARGSRWYCQPEIGSRVVVVSIPNAPSGNVLVTWDVGLNRVEVDVNPRLLRGPYALTAQMGTG